MDITQVQPLIGGGEGKAVLTEDRAQLVTSGGRGKYYEAAQQNRVFTGTMAAAGAVLPIFSNTAQVCGLWNERGSGIDLELIKIGFSYIDQTGAAGGYVLAIVKNAPAQLATGAAMTAFTDGALNTSIFNARVGSERGPKAHFTPSAATVTAPIILRHLSLNQTALTAAATEALALNNEVLFDGDLIIPPGNAVFVAGNIATLAKWAVSITWAEGDAR